VDGFGSCDPNFRVRGGRSGAPGISVFAGLAAEPGDGGAGAFEVDACGGEERGGAVVAEGEHPQEQVVGVAVGVAAALELVERQLEDARRAVGVGDLRCRSGCGDWCGASEEARDHSASWWWGGIITLDGAAGEELEVADIGAEVDEDGDAAGGGEGGEAVEEVDGFDGVVAVFEGIFAGASEDAADVGGEVVGLGHAEWYTGVTVAVGLAGR
jgi:hypothetical protein